ncbi:hypothetical protein SAMN05444354_102369 [Stigmatella aurantiaca]|uniref:Uncharacterized protein n=1 Tax=Stigmatella aurantiaca TaxID=41 RepID=A0A1H7JYN1_STIAU|nr:hypothetical protein [Stigmatella aurantiaca]SEK79688.1 hypothetical protein SAMN05444354_102369 [Stigmatella aurantiaca]
MSLPAFPKKSLRHWIQGGLCVWLMACGASPVEEMAGGEPPSLSTLEAATQTCSENTLSWTPGIPESAQVCSGPIEYSLKCYAAKATSVCTLQGYQQKTCYPACRDPSFGVEEYKTLTGSKTIEPHLVSKRWECTPEATPGSPSKQGAICEWVYTWDYDAPCKNAAENAADAYPPALNALEVKVQSFHAPHAEGGDSTCTYTLVNVPKTYNVGNSAVCGAGSSCNDTTKPIYKSCRHINHGLAANTAECGPVKRYTAAGASMTQAWTEATSAWTARQTDVVSTNLLDTSDFVQVPTCKTCEDKPLSPTSTQSTVNTKYTCLDTQLNAVSTLPSGVAPSGVNRAALESQLTAALKLLYELKADLLTPAQQSRIRALYTSAPTAKIDCGVSFAAPAVSPSCVINLGPLNAQLDMCMRLTASHVPAAAAYTGIDACIDLADDVAVLGEPICQGEAYREAWRGAWQGMFERSVSSLKREASLRPQHAELQAKLATIQRWYSASRQFLSPTPADDAQLWKDLSKTFSIFWKGLYQGGLLDSSSAQLNTSVVDPFNTGLQTDAAVLAAALQPAPGASQLPLQGPPLLMLMGDSLRGLHERMEDFSRLHDLGCRFKGCAAGAVKTEVSELWSLFAAMASPTELQGAVNGATHLAGAPSPRRQEWRTLFGLLQQRHGEFQNAVTTTLGTTPYSPTLLTGAQLPSLPEPAVALARLIQDGMARTQSYQASGIFLSTLHDSLHMGIQETKQQALDMQISTSKQALQNAIVDYQNSRSTFIGARVQEMNNTQTQQTLEAHIEQKQAQFGHLAEDLAGLRANAATEEAAFSNFAQSFNTLLEAEGADVENLALERGPPQLLSLSAANARFVSSSSSGGDLNNFAVQKNGAVWKLETHAGDMVNVTVSGQWTPSCALSTAQFFNPSTAQYSPLSQGAPLTGPEGYLVSYQNNSFSAQAYSHTEHSSSSNSDRACAGLKAEFTIGGEFAKMALGASMSAYASAEACMSSETGSRDASEQTNTWEQRASAAYSTGVRVPNTPFPRFPAGSLLLVEMEKQGTNVAAIRDVHVVQASSNTFLIGAMKGLPQGAPDPGVDVYLVVNDTASCTPDASHALSVSVQHLVPLGAAAVQASKAMAQTLTDLRGSTELLVAQGRVLPHELIAKQEAAMAQLHLACAQCDLEQFPPSMMALYNAFLSKELAQMERRVEIRSVERALTLALLEMQGLANDLESTSEIGRMLRLVPAWSLRNLDGEQLRTSAQGLSTLVTDYLYPVIDLRYPSLLATLQTEPKLTQLVTADWTDSYVNLANTALDAVNSIQTGLSTARLGLQNPSLVMMGLSFPRPGRDVSQSLWRKASGERSAAVWGGLLSGDPSQPLRFTLQITPEDLYSVDGASTGTIQCSEATPILRRLVLFWARSGSSSTPNSYYNDQYLRSATQLSPHQVFPTHDGFKTYYMEKSQWLTGQSRMLFGLTSEVFSFVQSKELSLPEAQQTSTGEGLSPFSTMTFDVTGLRNQIVNPLNAADELIVFMLVDRIPASAPLPAPLICQ